MRPIVRLAALIAAAVLTLMSAAPALAGNHSGPEYRGSDQHATSSPGLVFVPTNDPAGNTVHVYARSSDGTLHARATYPTGGRGGALAGAVVDRLASQGSITYDGSAHRLYVVNAGSNTLSIFALRGEHLALQQVLDTDGTFPASVTARGPRVFVLNARDGGSIQGFRWVGRRLVTVPAWHRDLGLDPMATPEFTHTPGQVALTPDGRHVLVTTKAGSHAILTFALSRTGRLSRSAVVTGLPGKVPFAVAFDRRGHAVVAEASNNVATFAVSRTGVLTQLTEQATGQVATCWIAVSGRYAFASNAGSASVSAYRVGSSGSLTSIGVTATRPGTVDAAASSDGRYLYVQTGAQGTVDAFRIGRHGALSAIGSITVPQTTGGEGIAAT